MAKGRAIGSLRYSEWPMVMPLVANPLGAKGGANS